MSVEDKVKKIIAEKLSVDIAEVVPEASFVDDLGAGARLETCRPAEQASGKTLPGNAD
jgi:acyl carrier protein